MHDSEREHVRLGILKRLLVPYAVSGDLTMQRYACALLGLVECILPTKLTETSQNKVARALSCCYSGWFCVNQDQYDKHHASNGLQPCVPHTVAQATARWSTMHMPNGWIGRAIA